MKSREKNKSPVILKVLTGTQSGVEVDLADGEYTLGSGQDDDLQFVDVCLKSGHARIRIEGQSVLVAGGAGDVVTETGLTIAAGDDDWRHLEPLEVLSIGSSTFAFGATDANWSDLSAALADHHTAGSLLGKTRTAGFVTSGLIKFGLAASGSIILAVAVIWLVFGFFAADGYFVASAKTGGIESVRETLGRFPFGASIALREEVDGTIFATGYVADPAERRALHDAVEETGVPVHLRLGVLSSIRSEIAAAVESFGVDVEFELSSSGGVSLKGVILSDEKADRFSRYVREEVSGVSSVEAHVETANSYFAEVKTLAVRSGIGETVLLRLASERIEASGVIVTDKLDAWVGFIQSYARRFADRIPLTSYVQLVNKQGAVIAETSPTRLGAADPSSDASAQELDLARLKQGSVDVADIFPGLDNGSTVAKPEKRDVIANIAAPAKAAVVAVEGDLAKGARDLLARSGADEVLKTWDEKAPMANAAAAGASTKEVSARQRYLPLVVNPAALSDRCWEGSRLTVADIPVVLFWLDYLSLSKDASLAKLEPSNQYLLLEAALDPDRTRGCAQRLGRAHNVHFDKMSVFLKESARNPRFIRYLVRDFVAPPFDVAGVMLGNRGRYIQLRDGTKVYEGTSPTVQSKLMSIGALGSLLQQENNVAPIIYSDRLAWKATN
jgi:type III secretion system YscD/HrpQ family protein